MLDLAKVVNNLYRKVKWQKQPYPLEESELRAELHEIIVDAIRELYIVTGRAQQFTDSLFEVEGEMYVALVGDLPADEYGYVEAASMVMFFQAVQTAVNNIVGYATDALTITNADKPYLYLSTSIREYEMLKRMHFYKMTRYTLL